jgi:1-acyl-sn-glycerol-3-phosphate acyltransferase
VAGRQDFFIWRWFGTAASFALFGLFGIVLGALVWPLSRLLPVGAQRRQALCRRLMQACFRSFIGFMRGLGLLSYEFFGRERLGRPGQLIIANHPSLIDVVFLIGFTPAVGCVVKSAMWRNPFTAGIVRSTGYIRNWPTDEMIEGASAALRAGQALIMFPEGTRTTPGAPLQFHRGAASVAVRAAATLTPVLISVNPTTLTKHAPWYRIPAQRPHFRLEVGSDLELRDYREHGSLPMAGRALNEALLEQYRAALGAGTGTACGPPLNSV